MKPCRPSPLYGRWKTPASTQYPTLLDALAAPDEPPIYELSVTEARDVLIGAQAGPVAKLPADIEDRTIPSAARGDLSVRIVRPKGKT